MILDPNAVSALFEGSPALEALLSRQARHELPVIVIDEYRYGLARETEARIEPFEAVPLNVAGWWLPADSIEDEP
jgi:predicted nucleic acid-binding protein